MVDSIHFETNFSSLSVCCTAATNKFTNSYLCILLGKYHERRATGVPINVTPRYKTYKANCHIREIGINSVVIAECVYSTEKLIC